MPDPRDRRPVPGRASATGTPLGTRGQALHGRAASSCPTTITIRMLLDRLGPARRRRRRDPRRLPADATARRRRSTRRSPSTGRRRRAGARHRRPGDELVRADVRPLDLPRHRPPLPRATSTRRSVPGVCDVDGSPLYQRADDRPETVRARMAQQLAAAARGRRPLPRARASSGPSTGAGRSTTVDRAPLPRGRRRHGPTAGDPAAADGHPQVAAPRSRRCAAPAGSSPRCWRSSSRSSSRASRPPSSTGSPSATSAAPGAVPSFKGYLAAAATARPAASRLASASRSTTRSSTASRATARSSDGQIVSVDVGAIYDGWHGDGARTFVGRQIRDAESHAASSTPTRAGDDGRHRRRAAGQPHRRHLRRGRGRRGARAATASSASTSATASAPTMHEEPQVPNFRSAAEGIEARSPACAWPSSRCSRSAPRRRRSRADGWTVVTRDGSLAAHFEHTIAITDHGPEILTTV